ncbi:hypothetical protein BUALT_Bualt17G0027700 [Buddleja alternifolia]|uniref:F-box domain-containing protein n=1 Tax=Buddleja alternifolia TaxID=168488 RepID=A0AAV6WEZ8_9LAMI|nr:hypothetical protein BUALT_Bualt17G0027700 [Buddleja alternifolia]
MEGNPQPPPPPWVALETNLTENILKRLDLVDILGNVQRVCTTWHRVCRDPAMWRAIVIRNDGYLRHLLDIDKLCRVAVNRSDGQLRDITLEHFGDDKLLLFICERSTHLKRLHLTFCSDITSSGLATALKNTPEVEELHLNMMTHVYADDIDAIGNSCPMLKSFTFTRGSRDCPFESLPSELALAIAGSMPNLRHLGLFGSTMDNLDLKEILDKCPRLKWLDLRNCLKVDLGGDLGQRLSQQMTNLRRPTDSVCVWRYSSPFDDPPLRSNNPFDPPPSDLSSIGENCTFSPDTLTK